MKNFVAIYIGSAEAAAKWEGTDAQKQAGMQGWAKWMTDNSRSVVETGSPLGKTKRINRQGISDTKNKITGYTIVQAESHEAAAKLFVNHPHFMNFPGDSVEVMECLPIPKM